MLEECDRIIRLQDRLDSTGHPEQASDLFRDLDEGLGVFIVELALYLNIQPEEYL
jgi:hypothetical protein